MNFEFSEERVMLRDSVARLVQDDYDFEARRAAVAAEEGFSRDNWQTFADLGWLSIPFAEEYGGFGGDAVDTMVIMEQLGKGLVVEPYLATVLLFGGLIQEAGNAGQKDAWLSRIIGGEVQGAFAFVEKQSRYELADIATRAERQGDAYVINGEKTVVFNGAVADTLVVAARTSGDQFSEDGISLFLVDAQAEGVERSDYRMMDGQRVANIRFDNVSVDSGALLGAEGAAFTAMRPVVDRAILAVCAEALGVMEKLNATTVEYARTRQQFGLPIGSFQALQHRMVDTFMAYEQTRSLLYRCVCSVVEGSDEARRNLHALKVMVGKAGKLIGGEAIQLHGGMGITDELDVGHYAKRLLMINALFGNADYHQQVFNQLSYG